MSSSNVFCTICSERYRHTDNILAGSCGHAFHEVCLDRWREQSTTCPICRCEDAVYIQLYLNFEDSGEPVPNGRAPRGDASGENQRQGHSAATSSSSSSSSSSNTNGHSNNNNNGSNTDHTNGDLRGIMREYENMLYETGVYQEEIEYLNAQIGALTLINSQLKVVLNGSDSD